MFATTDTFQIERGRGRDRFWALIDDTFNVPLKSLAKPPDDVCLAVQTIAVQTTFVWLHKQSPSRRRLAIEEERASRENREKTVGSQRGCSMLNT